MGAPQDRHLIYQPAKLQDEGLLEAQAAEEAARRAGEEEGSDTYPGGARARTKTKQPSRRIAFTNLPATPGQLGNPSCSSFWLRFAVLGSVTYKKQ